MNQLLHPISPTRLSRAGSLLAAASLACGSNAFGASNPPVVPFTPSNVPVIVFFGAIVLIVGLVVWGRVRRSRLQHETMRVLAEKGLPIPPEMFQPPARRNDFRKGLVWSAIGVGLMISGFAGPVAASERVWTLGLIPLLIGVAFLVAWKVEQSSNRPKP